MSGESLISDKQNVVKNILDEFVGESVKIAQENFERNENILEKIDRSKLEQYNKDLWPGKLEAEKRNELLNKGLVKYFKRKKIFRAFSEENSEQVAMLTERYRQQLDIMDHAIGLNNRTDIEATNQIAEMTSSKIEMGNILAENVEIEEKKMKEIGLSLQSSQTGHFLSETSIDALLRKLADTRNKISEERFDYIKTIDKHTEIDLKVKALQDLGNGLRLIDYEQLLAERQSLSEKIEERNNDLIKLRLRSNGVTQILAHVREKDTSINSIITRESDELKSITEEMNSTRAHVNMKKIERDTLRSNVDELIQSTGLLARNDLLHDYDNTYNIVKKKEQQIDDMSKSLSELNAKIAKLLLQIKQTNAEQFSMKQNKDVCEKPLPRILQGVKLLRR